MARRLAAQGFMLGTQVGTDKPYQHDPHGDQCEPNRPLCQGAAEGCQEGRAHKEAGYHPQVDKAPAQGGAVPFPDSLGKTHPHRPGLGGGVGSGPGGARSPGGRGILEGSLKV